MRVVKSTEFPSTIEGMCRWVSDATFESFDPNYTMGISVIDRLGAATVLYHHYYPQVDCQMSIRGAGAWATPEALTEFFSFPFVELGLRRVTAAVARNNKRSRKLCERVGYKMEGVRRKAYRNGQNEIIYGMLREECRYLNEMRKAA